MPYIVVIHLCMSLRVRKARGACVNFYKYGMPYASVTNENSHFAHTHTRSQFTRKHTGTERQAHLDFYQYDVEHFPLDSMLDEQAVLFSMVRNRYLLLPTVSWCSYQTEIMVLLPSHDPMKFQRIFLSFAFDADSHIHFFFSSFLSSYFFKLFLLNESN